METALTLRDFKRQIRKSNEHREHEIKNSLGIRQAFLYVQSHKWFDIGMTLKERQFQQIIRSINEELSYELMSGNSIIFPKQMGSLDVVKHSTYAYYNNGKLRTNYRINWNKTLQLWYEDEEAKNNKTIVRDVLDKERFCIVYNRNLAKYTNKCYIHFRTHRSIYRILKQGLNQGLLDAYGTRRIYKD